MVLDVLRTANKPPLGNALVSSDKQQPGGKRFSITDYLSIELWINIFNFMYHDECILYLEQILGLFQYTDSPHVYMEWFYGQKTQKTLAVLRPQTTLWPLGGYEMMGMIPLESAIVSHTVRTIQVDMPRHEKGKEPRTSTVLNLTMPTSHQKPLHTLIFPPEIQNMVGTVLLSNTKYCITSEDLAMFAQYTRDEKQATVSLMNFFNMDLRDANDRKFRVLGNASMMSDTHAHGICFIPPKDTDTIDGSQYSHNGRMTQFVLTPEITTIESYAFRGSALRKINLGASAVTKIEMGAFSFCMYLPSEIHLPPKLRILPRSCFTNSTVKTVVFNPELIGIEPLALSNTSMEELSITNTIHYLGTSFCANNSHLTRVDLSASVHISIIPAFSFSECKTLTRIRLPPNLTNIDEGAFEGCGKLETVEFPPSKRRLPPCVTLSVAEEDTRILTIGERAFRKCAGLTKLDIPYNYLLGAYAFSGCSVLSSEFIVGGYVQPNVPEGIFYHCRHLASVDFREGTITIGAKVCQSCIMTAIHIPKSVVEVEDSAFEECHSIDELEFGSNIQKLGKRAFANCLALAAVYFDPPVKNVNDVIFGSGVFAECTCLRTCMLPDNIRELPRGMFLGCTSLGTLNMKWMNIQKIGAECFRNNTHDIKPRSMVLSMLTYLGPTAFHNNHMYTSINIETADIEILYKDTFSGMCNLMSLTLPKKVRLLGDNLCKNCTKLWDIDIPGRVYCIPPSCFENCHSMKHVTLHCNKVLGTMVIGKHAFKGCAMFLGIVQHNVSFMYHVLKIEGAIGKIGEGAFAECNNIREIEVGETVELGKNVFAYCANLQKATINGSLVPDDCFQYCTDLKTVTLRNTRMHLGRQAFNWCTALERVIVDEGNGTVTCTLLAKAFYHCTALTQIPHEWKIKKIPSQCFAHCTGLETMLLAQCNNIGPSAFQDSGVTTMDLTHVTCVQKDAFKNCIGLHTVQFGSNPVKLLDGAFCNTGIVHLKLPNVSVDKAAYVFARCLKLVSVCYEPTTTTDKIWIGPYMFAMCDKLTSCKFAENTVGIKSHAFEMCIALLSIRLPAGLTTIETAAFMTCVKLRSVQYDTRKLISAPDVEEPYTFGRMAFGRCVHLRHLQLERHNIQLGESCFEDCARLQSARFRGNGTLEIANYAFNKCVRLKAVYFGDAELQLGTYVFARNRKLRVVRFPPIVHSIGEGSFTDCSGLPGITLPTNKTFTKLETSLFQGCTALRFMHVPGNIHTIKALALCEVQHVILDCYEYTKYIVHWRAFPAVQKLAYLSNYRVEGGVTPKLRTLQLSAGISSFWLSNGNTVSMPHLTRIDMSHTKICDLNETCFTSCANLEEIYLPRTLKIIPYATFRGLHKLHTVENLTHVQHIGTSAFERCGALRSVQFGILLDHIAVNAFSMCKALTDVDFSLTTKDVKLSNGAFNRCTALVNITLPTKTTFLDRYLFMGCTALKSVYMPTCIERVSVTAFYNCVNLDEWYTDATTITPLMYYFRTRPVPRKLYAISSAYTPKKHTCKCPKTLYTGSGTFQLQPAR